MKEEKTSCITILLFSFPDILSRVENRRKGETSLEYSFADKHYGKVCNAVLRELSRSADC